MPQSSYPYGQDEESIFRTKSAVRGLPWWVLFAVILSVAVHIMLYVAFIELPLGDYFKGVSWRSQRDQVRERIQISPDLLNEVDLLESTKGQNPISQRSGNRI